MHLPCQLARLMHQPFGQRKRRPKAPWDVGAKDWFQPFKPDQKVCLTPTAMARPESRSVSFSREKAAYTLVRLDKAWS